MITTIGRNVFGRVRRLRQGAKLASLQARVLAARQWGAGVDPLMAFEKPAAPAPGPRSGVPVISLLDY